MDRDEFLSKIEQVDERLAQMETPIHARPVAAFREMSPGYEGPLLGWGVDPSAYPEYVGPNLLWKINAWYKERYADRINVPTTLGRIPFLLRGQVYTARIPLIYGEPRVDPLTFVDGMSESMMKSLTSKELKDYMSHWTMGFELVYEMEDMLGSNDTTRYGPVAEELIRKALADREAAVDSLGTPHLRTNISCFHSQQHAEKLLKAVVANKRAIRSDQLKKLFGHDVKRLLEECLTCDTNFVNVLSDMHLIANIPMDIRYSLKEVEPSVAVEAYFAALRIGGVCATVLSGHQRRLGTTVVSVT